MARCNRHRGPDLFRKDRRAGATARHRLPLPARRAQDRRLFDYLTLGLVAVLVLVNCFGILPCRCQFAFILIVAAIPVAMPAVLSVTMAVGATHLARKKAIVTKLDSIEEMAGMDVLCSDKTGTLTQNKLTLGDPGVRGQGPEGGHLHRGPGLRAEMATRLTRP